MPDSLKTKNALAASLKALMQQRPFSRISVSDICEGCGMTRKSFYYHFKDKYDLVNWIFDTEFFSRISLSQYESGWLLLTDICRYFYSERDFYRCALAIQGQNSFQDYFSVKMRPLVPRFLSGHAADSPDGEFFLNFLYEGLIQAILYWLSREETPPAEEFLEKMKRMLLLFSEDVLHTLGEDTHKPQA